MTAPPGNESEMVFCFYDMIPRLAALNLARDLPHFFALDGTVRLEHFDQLIERIIIVHQFLQVFGVFPWRTQASLFRRPHLPTDDALLTRLGRWNIESDELIALDERMFGARG
jgi:hypothetical protein